MANLSSDALRLQTQQVSPHSLYRKRPQRAFIQTSRLRVNVSPLRKELGRTAASPLSPTKWTKRRKQRFLSVVEEGLISVKGAQTLPFTPVLLSAFIMKRSPQPPRLLSSARYTLKSHPIESVQAEKRFSSASPNKRRSVRPRTSALPLKESPIEDGLTAWD